ncbi:MAG: hypothetical protein F2874_06535 [Actinobacteria bacterium]|nr:hypothetical protein [Actinomycetota bacterium]
MHTLEGDLNVLYQVITLAGDDDISGKLARIPLDVTRHDDFELDRPDPEAALDFLEE